MPKSREEALLENILGATNELGVPKSRIEKIWHYALGATIELEPAKSRIEELAIQVAEQVRNGGGGITPTGTVRITMNGTFDIAQYASANVDVHDIEDGLIDRSISGEYSNPRVDKIGSYSLYGRPDITKAAFALVGAIGQSAMQNCYGVKVVELPSATGFGANSFKGCSELEVLNLYSPDRESTPTMSNTNALDGTKIANGTGYIVINDDLVSELQGKTNWSTYASQIVSYTYAIEHHIL